MVKESTKKTKSTSKGKTKEEKKVVNPLLGDEDETETETDDQEIDTEEEVDVEDEIQEDEEDTDETPKDVVVAPKKVAKASATPERPKAIETSFRSDALRMKAHLDKQPKVSVMIPRREKEAIGTYDTVTLNGYKFVIKKGEYVSVPEQVAKIIMERYGQTGSPSHQTKIKDSDNTANLAYADEARRNALDI